MLPRLPYATALVRPLAGLGWSVDQVLRRALDLLEDTHVEPEPAGHVFTRKEVEESVTQLADHVSGPVFVPADGERRED